MLVNDGIKGETIPPRGGEVPHVYVVVASRLHLAPEQQRVLGCSCGLVLLGDHSDILDLEPVMMILLNIKIDASIMNKYLFI